MKAHRLDRIIQIYQRSINVDSVGHPGYSWTLYGEKYAALVPKRASSANQDEQLVQTEVFEMVIRYDAGVRPGYAVKHQGQSFWIDYIKPEGRLQWLTLGLVSTENRQPDLPS